MTTHPHTRTLCVARDSPKHPLGACASEVLGIGGVGQFPWEGGESKKTRENGESRKKTGLATDTTTAANFSPRKSHGEIFPLSYRFQYPPPCPTPTKVTKRCGAPGGGG